MNRRGQNRLKPRHVFYTTVAWDAVFSVFFYPLVLFALLLVPFYQIIALSAFCFFVWALLRPDDWLPASLLLSVSLCAWSTAFVQLFSLLATPQT